MLIYMRALHARRRILYDDNDAIMRLSFYIADENIITA